jgi:hypothetical protein
LVELETTKFEKTGNLTPAEKNIIYDIRRMLDEIAGPEDIDIVRLIKDNIPRIR